ncbi:hypothetical protein EYF80_041402 [Liparis tanakae]|uniref:Uncharacterized protein n=1 Tax=Liparis tanakae TaxID=230148 RepID=A0A4Z2G4B6_9TELE|nr:hypothetical protein EYF80_041402 [Liparis tanakae]
MKLLVMVPLSTLSGALSKTISPHQVPLAVLLPLFLPFSLYLCPNGRPPALPAPHAKRHLSILNPDATHSEGSGRRSIPFRRDQPGGRGVRERGAPPVSSRQSPPPLSPHPLRTKIPYQYQDTPPYNNIIVPKSQNIYSSPPSDTTLSPQQGEPGLVAAGPNNKGAGVAAPTPVPPPEAARPPAPPVESPVSRPKRKRDHQDDMLLKDITNLGEGRIALQQKLLEADEYSRFGQTVADMLRRVPEDKRPDVMYKVYGLIHENRL